MIELTKVQLEASLGNIRLSYTNYDGNPKKLEETHYYPFGLKHSKYNASKSKIKLKVNNQKQLVPTNVNGYKYKYNGKEYQDELGLNVYDYGARVYDPAAPHFWQIDPRAEEMR